jgi:hypothetical protein
VRCGAIELSGDGAFHDREDFYVLFRIKVFAIMGVGRRIELRQFLPRRRSSKPGASR